MLQSAGKTTNQNPVEFLENDDKTGSTNTSDSPFFGSVTDHKQKSYNNKSDDDFFVSLNIGSHVNLALQIDTGADETVLPAEYRDKNFPFRPPPPNKTLYAPVNNHLHCIKVQCLPIQYGKQTSYRDVYLLDDHRQLLLGKPTIRAFGMVKCVNQIQSKRVNHIQNPDLDHFFHGIGQLPEKYQYRIGLRENSLPKAIAVPRRVPLPLLEETRKELERLEEKGITSCITEATDWCSPLVVASKPGGKQDTSVYLVDEAVVLCHRTLFFFPLLLYCSW